MNLTRCSFGHKLRCASFAPHSFVVISDAIASEITVAHNKEINLFAIQSTISNRKLTFSNHDNDYFFVEISGNISASVNVWAYTDASGLIYMFNELASYDKPWKDIKSWESIEGEFKISASCTSLGAVTFEVEIKDLQGAPEHFELDAGIETEFSQLQKIAKNASIFFNAKSA